MHIELSWPNTVTFRLRLTVNKCHQRSKMALVDDEAEEEGWMGWVGMSGVGGYTTGPGIPTPPTDT